MSQSPQTDSTQKIGKSMFLLMWVVVFGLLVLFFDDHLSDMYNPNQSPEASDDGYQQEVKLKRNRFGHYVSSGFINGHPVTFLLDTGATTVSIPAHLGNKLGLYKGQSYPASTANGTVTVFDTNINQLRLGSITVSDVQANLNPGMNDEEILLGMSVLKNLEFTQRGDWLILRTP